MNKIVILSLCILMSSCEIYHGGARYGSNNKYSNLNYFINIKNNSPKDVYVKYERISLGYETLKLKDDIVSGEKMIIKVKKDGSNARVVLGFDGYEKVYIHEIPIFRDGKEWEIGLSELIDVTINKKIHAQQGVAPEPVTHQ